MSFFKSRYGRTFYRAEGDHADQTPLIAVHGGPGGYHQTIETVFKLQNEREVILYDQIGTGQSERIDKSLWCIDTFTDNLQDLINHRGNEKFILLGSSWGCTLILEYCRKYGFNKIEAIVFQSAMFSERLWSDDAGILKKTLSVAEQEIISRNEEKGTTESEEYRAVMNTYYSKYISRSSDIFSFFTQHSHLMNAEMYLHMWGPNEFRPTGILKGYDQTSFLKKITIPVLYLCGEFDEVREETCRQFQDMTPGSQLNIIRGAAHMCSYDEPEEYLRILGDFISKLN